MMMTPARRRVVGALVCAACLAAVAVTAPAAAPQTRQTPQRDTRQTTAAPTGAGALGGVVTNEDGSRPVRSAIVVLIGMMTGALRVSSTDMDGKFLFPDLPADRFIVGASKPPYLGMIAGAKRPMRSGTPIVLAEAQKIANVSIRMSMGAAIAGAVVDEKGLPAANVQVGVYQWRMQSGERVPVGVGVPENTDDRGKYRLFGLAPGEYLVATYRPGMPSATRALTVAEVDAALRGGPVTAAQASANLRYAPAYFPGTARASDAAPITVAAGEERGNVDFRLEVARAVRVEGAVVTSDGQMPARLAVQILTRGPLESVMSAAVQPDGRFTIANVMPGSYSLRVNAGGQPGPQFAQTNLEVAGADVTGIQLVLRPALSMTGAIVFRGAARPPALAGWRIPVRTVGYNLPSPAVQPTTDDGSFAITNMFPGIYAIGAGTSFGPTIDSATWALESVTLDGRDVTDLPAEVPAEAQAMRMVVTFTDRFQELSGRITRATGEPAPEHTIVVFPADKAYWMSGSRRIVTARPGTDGKFVLSGAGPTTLPPGKYLVAAVTDLERDEQFDPVFLSALVPASVAVTLQPGEKRVQDLVIR